MTGDTWTYWTCAEGTATTAAISNSIAWGTWTADSGTSAITNVTWKAWTVGTVIGTTNAATNAATWTTWANSSAVKYKAWKPEPPTEAELERRRVETERQRADAEARRVEQAVANVRADALLAEFLDAMQQGQMEKDLAFMVKSETGKTYRIKRGWSHNVEELNAAGLVVASYCIHPLEGVPYGDNMLAQKLMLETNEAEFLRVANRSARVR